MPQIFHRSFNVISRVTIFGFFFILALIAWVLVVWVRSSYATNVGITRDQPVPFSHRHHAGELGIDCRYCHQSVEQSSYAGIPATKVCMNCHQQIWTGSAMLEPVRASFRDGKSIPWSRVHRLADFVYFNHSVHVNKGFGCSTCHGPVSDMPLIYQHGSLLMEWCLECHNNPERYIRPKNQVFNMDWDRDRPPAFGKPGVANALLPTDWNDKMPPDENGRKLVEKYGVRKLIHCSTCHR